MNEPAQTLPPFTSFDDFAEWEEQDGRYEYADGHAVEISGTSPRHSALAVRVLSLLRAQLKPDWIILAGGQRIEARNSASRYLYADGSVLCGKPKLTLDNALRNPNTLVQVLSHLTEARDRGAKWESHQQHDSLQDYIVVSQQTQRVEHFTRGYFTRDAQQQTWSYRAVQQGSIKLASGAELALTEVYAGVMHLPAD